MTTKQRLLEIMHHVNPDFKLIKEYVEPNEINEILSGYIQAALFTEEENLKEQHTDNNPDVYDLDDADDELEKLMKLTNNFKHKSIIAFSREDIEPNSLITAYNDIKKFLNLAGDSVDEAIDDKGLERLGIDIWYTRNGHGAGFFDHSYDYDNEKKLISAGKALGSVDLFINKNLKLSFTNED